MEYYQKRSSDDGNEFDGHIRESRSYGHFSVWGRGAQPHSFLGCFSLNNKTKNSIIMSRRVGEGEGDVWVELEYYHQYYDFNQYYHQYLDYNHNNYNCNQYYHQYYHEQE